MGMMNGGRGSKYYGYGPGAPRGDFTISDGLIVGALFAIPTFGLSLIILPLFGIRDSLAEYRDNLEDIGYIPPQIPSQSSKTFYYRGKPYTKAT